MIADDIKARLDEMATHILFDYNGKECGIDPLEYNKRYDVWYGESDYTAKSVDEVMAVPLFDGKCLNEIADKIENLEL